LKRPSALIRPETTPLYASSVYTFPNLDAVQDYYSNTGDVQYLYRRTGHPNQVIVEEMIANLEDVEAATVCASGMAAISHACFAHLKPGDHVVSAAHIYGGTHVFFEQILKPWGVEVSYCQMDSEESVTSQIRDNTKLLFAESIANPLLQVTDLAMIGQIAQRLQLHFFVDNTFATPLLVHPVALGATLSIHSMTKYLNGHSDVIAGVVAGHLRHVLPVRQFGVTFGGVLAPFDAWMTERGLQTLSLRFRQQCQNAAVIADFLNTCDNIRKVHYPGLVSHPTHPIAKQLFTDGYGAMVSFELNGGLDVANRFIEQLQHIEFAPSLGGVKTTLSHPGLTSHRAYTVAQRLVLGIPDGLIRLSVGVEPVRDLLDDLQNALSRI